MVVYIAVYLHKYMLMVDYIAIYLHKTHIAFTSSAPLSQQLFKHGFNWCHVFLHPQRHSFLLGLHLIQTISDVFHLWLQLSGDLSIPWPITITTYRVIETAWCLKGKNIIKFIFQKKTNKILILVHMPIVLIHPHTTEIGCF